MEQTTKCVSAAETHRAYLDLVASRMCGDGSLCLQDDCEHCGPLCELVDQKGEECVQRGCTLARCIYD